MEIRKVTITVETPEGIEGEASFVVPKTVSNKFLADLICWKENWQGTFKEVEEFNQHSKDFSSHKPITPNKDIKECKT